MSNPTKDVTLQTSFRKSCNCPTCLAKVFYNISEADEAEMESFYEASSGTMFVGAIKKIKCDNCGTEFEVNA